MTPENDSPKTDNSTTPNPSPANEPTWRSGPDTIVDREPATDAAQSVEPAEPVAQPVAAPQMITSSRRMKKPLILAIAAGAVVLLLGSTAAAYQFWYQNPDKVVTDAITKALNAKTMTYTGSIDTMGETTVKVALNGSFNDSATANAAKITISSGAVSINVEGEAQTHKNGDLYVKIKNAKDLTKSLLSSSGMASSNQALDTFVAKIDNKWIKLTAKDLDGQTDTTTTSCISDTLNKLQNDTATRREVTDLYAKQRFIVVKQSLGEKNGSLGYQLDVDNTKAKAFVTDLKKTKLYAAVQKCDKKFTLDEKDITKDDKDTTGTLELWADKWTHELTKVNAMVSDKDGKATVVVEPTFNKPVTITAPTDVMTIDQLKQEFTNLMMSLLGMPTDLSAMSSMNSMNNSDLSAMEMQLMGMSVDQ